MRRNYKRLNKAVHIFSFKVNNASSCSKRTTGIGRAPFPEGVYSLVRFVKSGKFQHSKIGIFTLTLKFSSKPPMDHYTMKCPVCGSTSIVSSNGYLVCTECGTVLDNEFVSEVQEYSSVTSLRHAVEGKRVNISDDSFKEWFVLLSDLGVSSSYFDQIMQKEEIEHLYQRLLYLNNFAPCKYRLGVHEMAYSAFLLFLLSKNYCLGTRDLKELTSLALDAFVMVDPIRIRFSFVPTEVPKITLGKTLSKLAYIVEGTELDVESECTGGKRLSEAVAELVGVRRDADQARERITPEDVLKVL